MARPKAEAKNEATPEPMSEPGEPSMRKGTLGYLTELHALNAALYRPTAYVFSVGVDGDDDQAHMIGEIPNSELIDGFRWLASTHGPGVYRIELRSASRGSVAARCTVRVAADLRRKAEPDTSAMDELRATVARQQAVIEQMQRGGVAALSTTPAPAVAARSPVQELGAMADLLLSLSTKQAAAPTPAANEAERILSLGIKVGKEAASAGGAGVASLIKEHAAELITLGGRGMALIERIVEARAKNAVIVNAEPTTAETTTGGTDVDG